MRPDLHMTLVNFRLYLENIILSSPKSSLFSSRRSQWDSLSCWQFPAVFPEPSTSALLDFSFLFRGFVPIDLVNFLSAFFKQADVLDVLGEAIYLAQLSFRSYTWFSSCSEFKRLEAHYHLVRNFNEGIVPSSPPLRPGSNSSRGSVSLPRDIVSRAPPSLTCPDNWVRWIGSYLSSGSKHILEGFRLRINVSFTFSL